VFDTSDANLVRRAQQGNKGAIGKLYDRYQEQMFRFAWSRVGDRQLAEDITGEIFTRMVTHLPEYRATAVPFSAWLYQIARNLITDVYRRQDSRILQPLENAHLVAETQESPDMMVEHQLTIEKIQAALETIDPQQREAVTLRFLTGLSLREAAETMDCSVAALKSLQHRGLQALRVALK